MKGVLGVLCVLFGGGEVANDKGKHTQLKSFVITSSHFKNMRK